MGKCYYDGLSTQQSYVEKNDRTPVFYDGTNRFSDYTNTNRVPVSYDGLSNYVKPKSEGGSSKSVLYDELDHSKSIIPDSVSSVASNLADKVTSGINQSINTEHIKGKSEEIVTNVTETVKTKVPVAKQQVQEKIQNTISDNSSNNNGKGKYLAIGGIVVALIILAVVLLGGSGNGYDDYDSYEDDYYYEDDSYSSDDEEDDSYSSDDEYDEEDTYIETTGIPEEDLVGKYESYGSEDEYILYLYSDGTAEFYDYYSGEWLYDKTWSYNDGSVALLGEYDAEVYEYDDTFAPEFYYDMGEDGYRGFVKVDYIYE